MTRGFIGIRESTNLAMESICRLYKLHALLYIHFYDVVIMTT